MLSYTRYISLFATTLLAVGAMSCGSQTEVSKPTQKQLPMIGTGVQAMPRALVYQVSGDNCMDLVPITLTADGKGVASYPAPSDLNEGQTPINLGDGWWLDRRGITPQTVFTTYTYEEYEAMKSAPTVRELLAHIDKNAHITRIMALPVSAAEAAADPAVARVYTESGFKDCIELLNRR